jgi:predicted transcriptional regulator
MRTVQHTKREEKMALARTNLTLPRELLREVDKLAGPRGRSRYVAEAVAQRVRRDALGAAIRETAGAMRGRPGWMSPDEVVRWVDELRSEETD